ncbi:DUF2167 domain-containing protein [Paenibacillus sp. MMO-58]|uniref:DUF2167 domain-containing protein n=1 Tax=Paenibacillus sp. MMO-58 TaxID=3081290 RepID=UPI0030163EDC
MVKARLQKWLQIGLITCLMLTGLPAVLHADGENADAQTLNWVQGTGQTVELGDGLADLKLREDFVFLDGDDARAYQEQLGGMPTNREIGVVFPSSENESWALYFEYEETGYVNESEKDDIDADKLLQSYKKGTEEMNKELDEANRLYVEGWDVAPFYDEKMHSLAWSLLAHDADQSKLINYNVRLLSRQGVVSAVLVSDPEHLAADRQTMEDKLLPAFRLKEGQRYEDYNADTDKKASFGLTGLILGGVGVVAAKKLGLLAVILVFAKKFWILIVAAGAAVMRFLRGRKTKQPKDDIDLDNGQSNQTL